MIVLANTLYYQGIEFQLTEITTKARIYTSADGRTIFTAPADYDGALIGAVDESFREDSEDDMVRYFDSVTGLEEE